MPQSAPSPRNPPSRAVARTAVIAAIAATGAMAALGTMGPDPERVTVPAALGRASVEPLALDNAQPADLRTHSFVREERFGRGESIGSFLARAGVRENDARRLIGARGLRLLRPGEWVSVETNGEGALMQLTHLAAREVLVTITPEGNGFRLAEARAPLVMRTVVKSGVIRSSLFAAADTVSVPDSVAIQLADIFGGDIDFHRDLRKDDRFSVVYEMYFLAGRPVHSGRVLAAEFVGQGKVLRALHFSGREGSVGYFAPDGRSLRKTFLRSPLEFSRITSRFGTRMHPFRNTWQTHRGIDYGAPQGTRVRATADGVVVQAERQGGYGNVVHLRHGTQYTTVYAHLSGFARGLRAGTRVSQGDTIGFVGQTGWATGPHLHYEFRVGGTARNPLSVSLPAAQPVPMQEMASFRERAAPLVAQLDLLGRTDLALLE